MVKTAALEPINTHSIAERWDIVVFEDGVLMKGTALYPKYPPRLLLADIDLRIQEVPYSPDVGAGMKRYLPH